MMSAYTISAVLVFLCCCRCGFSKATSHDVHRDEHRIEKRDAEGTVTEQIFDKRNKLTVMTANAYEKKITEFVPTLNKNWDILFLPEVKAVNTSVPFHVMYDYVYPDNPNIWGYFITDSATLSHVILFKSKLNVKIKSYQAQSLPISQGDASKQRHGLYIDMSIDNFDFVLLNVHLTWGAGGFSAPENVQFIEETVKKFSDGKNFVFGGAMNTKASLVKDKVKSAGFSIFPTNVITVWDGSGWACSDFLISNLKIINKNIQETFSKSSQHNHVWATYEVPKMEKKYDSNNFANAYAIYKNELN